MDVKLDEALSRSLEEILNAYGYGVKSVYGQGWGGLKDPVLWPRVADEKIYFITCDKGFGDVRNFPPGTHAGILLLRPHRESLYAYKALLGVVLRSHRLETLVGMVTVVTPRSIRVRRAPLESS